jgi:DNA-binding NtrC family response regulator
LIQGESGTGKELVSRAIHHGKHSCCGAFYPLQIAWLFRQNSPNRCFFGHVRGAFTGATSDRKGWFEPANNGTLFLDAAEHVLIQRALNHSGGNVAEAARLPGVNRSRIYRRFPNQV